MRFVRPPQKKRWKSPIPIDREKFRAWLKGKAPKEVVGVRCEAGNCPVANFHNAGETPYKIKIIADDEMCVAETQERGSSEVLQVPYWVEWFVNYLDDDVDEEGDFVTAEQAMRILSELT